MVSASTTVIVTGAAGGIGAALCDAFRAEGDIVIGLDKSADAMPAGAIGLEVDLLGLVRDDQLRRSALRRLDEVVAEHPVRALVNNAAVQVLGDLTSLDLESWRVSMDVNVLAPLVLTRHLHQQLASGGGSVINIASVHATLTKKGFAAYSTSKSALLGLTRALALELAPQVRVNAICPAAVDTPMLRAGLSQEALNQLADYHPLRCIGTPAQIAATAVWLASPAAGFMTGSSIASDGGIVCQLHDPG